MAHTHVTHMPSRLGATISTTRYRSQIIRRRRLLLLVLGTILLSLAISANLGPLRSYFDARGRLAEASASVAELSEQKAELQDELSRLGEVDYMESLARQELSYARPGEELYIVTGAGYPTVPAQSGSPGFMERVLSPLLD